MSFNPKKINEIKWNKNYIEKHTKDEIKHVFPYYLELHRKKKLNTTRVKTSRIFFLWNINIKNIPLIKKYFQLFHD